jgi:GntR family transcriptional repressor for pyruvate dehydrogenase complex
LAAKQSRDVAIQPVRQSRIYTEIVDQVLGLIKSGNVGVGDRLPSERQLAQQLNVSRSALREAMTALEVLGIVEIKPGVGIFIGPDQRPADDATVVEQVSDLLTEVGPIAILEARALFEPGVAKLAATRRTEFDLAAMDDTVRQMESELQRGNEGWEPDWGFHKALSAATRNPFAELVLDTLGQRMQNQLWRRMRAHNFELLHRGQRYAQDHRTILEAVRQGDGDAAFRAMHTHIRTIQADLEADHTLLQVNIAETK